MGEIKECVAILATGLTDFNNQAAGMILQGWTPIGGVSITESTLPMADGVIHKLLHFAQSFGRYN